MTTYAQLMDSSDVFGTRPVLSRVAGEIADVQVRNRGTIGGNVCLSDPTNHFPPLMVAMNASFTIAGPSGERPVSADEFFQGVYMTAVQPGELLTKITIPPAQGDGFAAVTIGKDGTCIVNAAATKNGETRFAIGCVAAVPVTSLDDLDPPSDVHGSAEYRRHLAKILVDRAIAEAGGTNITVTINGETYQRDVDPVNDEVSYLYDPLNLGVLLGSSRRRSMPRRAATSRWPCAGRWPAICATCACSWGWA